jgi:hypothetical protein
MQNSEEEDEEGLQVEEDKREGEEGPQGQQEEDGQQEGETSDILQFSPCADGSHGCNSMTTVCQSIELNIPGNIPGLDSDVISYECQCLEGYVEDPIDQTNCVEGLGGVTEQMDSGTGGEADEDAPQATMEESGETEYLVDGETEYLADAIQTNEGGYEEGLQGGEGYGESDAEGDGSLPPEVIQAVEDEGQGYYEGQEVIQAVEDEVQGYYEGQEQTADTPVDTSTATETIETIASPAPEEEEPGEPIIDEEIVPSMPEEDEPGEPVEEPAEPIADEEILPPMPEEERESLLAMGMGYDDGSNEEAPAGPMPDENAPEEEHEAMLMGYDEAPEEAPAGAYAPPAGGVEAADEEEAPSPPTAESQAADELELKKGGSGDTDGYVRLQIDDDDNNDEGTVSSVLI